MPHARTLLLAPLTLAALLTGLVAPSAPVHAAVPAAAAHDLLLLRTGQGTQAAYQALPVAAPRLARTLPLGAIDRAGRTLYAAVPAPHGRTIVEAIDTGWGGVLRSVVVDGTFSTRDGDFALGDLLTQGTPIGAALTGVPMAPSSAVAAGRATAPARVGYPADGSQILSALSFNGRWLALRDSTLNLTDSAAGTRVLVIDTRAMRVVADHTLPGQFGLDAVSDDGGLLYLIQALPQDGFQHYQVRAYEVFQHRLDPKPVVAPGEPAEKMSGEAWTRQWSPDGSWLYTLYVQLSGPPHVFIHALDLRARRTYCIDFPVIAGPAGNDFFTLSHFTLSVAPDGKTLYAVNPLLGTMAVISMPAGRVRMVKLGAGTGSDTQTDRMQDFAAISADGRALFVATNAGIWKISTTKARILTTYAAGHDIGSVALSPDGRRLYALYRSEGTAAILDAATGHVLDSFAADAFQSTLDQVAGVSSGARLG